MLIGWAVMAMIAASILFGFNLPVTLVLRRDGGLCGACVLYHTSNVLYHYNTGSVRGRRAGAVCLGRLDVLVHSAAPDVAPAPLNRRQAVRRVCNDGSANRVSDAKYDPLYLAGIEHFNVCDFFEAHETWEELWTDYQGPARKFYQGLIQVAVALHHFGNGNIRGAKKLYLSSSAYLAALPARLPGTRSGKTARRIRALLYRSARQPGTVSQNRHRSRADSRNPPQSAAGRLRRAGEPWNRCAGDKQSGRKTAFSSGLSPARSTHDPGVSRPSARRIRRIRYAYWKAEGWLARKDWIDREGRP